MLSFIQKRRHCHHHREHPRKSPLDQSSPSQALSLEAQPIHNRSNHHHHPSRQRHQLSHDNHDIPIQNQPQQLLSQTIPHLHSLTEQHHLLHRHARLPSLTESPYQQPNINPTLHCPSLADLQISNSKVNENGSFVDCNLPLHFSTTGMSISRQNSVCPQTAARLKSTTRPFVDNLEHSRLHDTPCSSSDHSSHSVFLDCPVCDFPNMCRLRVSCRETFQHDQFCPHNHGSPESCLDVHVTCHRHTVAARRCPSYGCRVRHSSHNAETVENDKQNHFQCKHNGRGRHKSHVHSALPLLSRFSSRSPSQDDQPSGSPPHFACRLSGSILLIRRAPSHLHHKLLSICSRQRSSRHRPRRHETPLQETNFVTSSSNDVVHRMPNQQQVQLVSSDPVSSVSMPCRVPGDLACSSTPRPLQDKHITLLDLGDDILTHIIHFVLEPVRVTSSDRIVENGFLAALPVASVCRRLRSLFFSSMRDLELWQSGSIPSTALTHIAKSAGSHLKRIVLRNCNNLQPEAIVSLSRHCSNIRTIDISNVHVVNDDLLDIILMNCGRTLRSLLVRACVSLTDDSMRSLAHHAHALDALDMSGLPSVTDDGMTAFLACRGHSLVSLVCSNCPGLTDMSFHAMGFHCPNLEVICARRLSRLTNSGVDSLCRGIGDKLEVLDVLDCENISVKPFLESVSENCPRLASRFMDGEGRTLKQVIISSLASFIFHVTGRDAFNGRSAVYFLLVDPGTSNCFRVSVGNEHMNLVDYGTILCSCFGERPNDHVRETLLSEYGLDLDADDHDLG